MRISGIAAAVPSRCVRATDSIGQFDEETVQKITANTGVHARRVSSDDLCTSDLCVEAAERLLTTMAIDRESIDALLFVSQTADYVIPATSPLLQVRLGLTNRTFTLDLNQGCTGFTDGLLVAHSLMRGLGFKRVLLLCGDTPSKTMDPEDQGVALLFGDAAAATLLEEDKKDILFSAGTDGEGSDYIGQKIGYRSGMSTKKAPLIKDIAVKLEGAEIFSFTIKRVPPMVKEAMVKADWSVDDVDQFIFHQANSFIINYLARKLRIPADKCPVSLDEFGNTSSASIPLTIVTRIAENLTSPQKLVLVGFGVGLAWSAIAIETDGVTICPLVEVGD